MCRAWAPAYYGSGNVLLDDLLGARRLSFPEGENEAGADAALHEEAARLRREGRKPYVIPLGLDNPPHGALGYMLAAREIVDQGMEFDCAVVGSGSGLTHAGLLCGLRALGVDARCMAPACGAPADLQRERIRTVRAKSRRSWIASRSSATTTFTPGTWRWHPAMAA